MLHGHGQAPHHLDINECFMGMGRREENITIRPPPERFPEPPRAITSKKECISPALFEGLNDSREVSFVPVLVPLIVAIALACCTSSQVCATIKLVGCVAAKRTHGVCDLP